MKKDSKRFIPLFVVLGILLVGWFILFLYSAHVSIVKETSSKLAGSSVYETAFLHFMSHPFRIFPVPKRTILLMIGIPALLFVFIGLFIMSKKGQEHEDKKTALSSNSWATEKDLRDYTYRCVAPVNSPKVDLKKNVIISDGIYLGLNHRETNRNVHSLVIAGSGRGKTWRYIVPNLLLANTSYICTDPSGELYRDYGAFFERMGYRIKVLNLAHMEVSNHYNPFAYIRKDEDVALLTEILIANTTPNDARASDPFWQNAESNFLNAAMLLIFKYYLPEDRSLAAVLDIIRHNTLTEDDIGKKQKKKDGMDELFDRYRAQDPTGAAFRFYDAFKAGAGRTKLSILQSVTSRLHHFNFDTIINLTAYDEMELETIGDVKTILFVVTPNEKKTYNFIAAMLYSQLFIRLYDYCETTAGFDQLLVDGNNEVIMTFRAEDEEDSNRVRKKAEKFLKSVKASHIVYNTEMDWYEVRTENNEFVAYRKYREDAEKVLQSLDKASIRRNTARLPIHVRFLMDEFANIASIPDFDNKISVCRKYEISISIILQSLKQIQSGKYRDVWDTITANCDSLCYLGGNADESSQKWFSTLCGKETRQIANQSFSNKGSSMSISPQLVDLVTPADLRTLKEREMIILLSGYKPCRGRMYDTAHHPNFKLVGSSKYLFNERKAILFATENRKIEKMFKKPDKKAEQVVEDEKREGVLESLNRARRQLAEEYKTNKDFSGQKIIETPSAISISDDTIAKTCDYKTEDDVKKAEKTMVELNRKLYEVFTEIRKVPHDRKRRQMAS